MNIYESVVIFTPNEKIAKEEIKKYTDLIQSYSKKKRVKVKNMGKKQLAYEIKTNKAGWYGVFTFQATPEDIVDLERHFRIDDNVVKFITVKHNDDEYDFPEDCLEDYTQDEEIKSEQQPDAMDVLLGFAEYKK